MHIAPPFGYKEIVPFLKTHKVRLLAPGEVPQFAQSANAIPVSHSEFQPACRHYPIVFTKAEGGGMPAAVAVLGMTAGENLFVSDGAWASGTYVPAYARRYPFCMARLNVNRVEHKDRLICVENSALDEAGEAMFDDKGEAGEKWKELERLLAEYEKDLERSREMCAILAEYALLEPFTMQATLSKGKGGGAMHMTGMQRVAEKKLEDLDAGQMKNLMRKGILARIYMHLLSLDNFGRLLERKGARA